MGPEPIATSHGSVLIRRLLQGRFADRLKKREYALYLRAI
jgi:hypothetical protein